MLDPEEAGSIHTTKTLARPIYFPPVLFPSVIGPSRRPTERPPHKSPDLWGALALLDERRLNQGKENKRPKVVRLPHGGLRV